MLLSLTMLNTDAFRGQNYRTELQFLVVGFLILFPGFFSFPLFVHHCIIFPHAVLCQSSPEEQIDLCEAPWTMLYIQLDAALLNKRGGPREPWTLQQGWWCPPNPASAESSVPMMFPPVPTGTSLQSWELILSAVSVAVELITKKDSEVFSRFVRGLAFSTPIFNWFRLEPLKGPAVPKISEENVAKPSWPNRSSYRLLQPPATMVSFLTQAILSHALGLGEAGFNSWRLSQEAGCLLCSPMPIYNIHMQRGHWFILQAGSTPKKQI